MSSTTRNCRTELKVGKKKIRALTHLINHLRETYGYKKCPTCGGKGTNKRYPYYATVMPEETEIPCEDCKGTGTVFVVPNDATIVRESNYH